MRRLTRTRTEDEHGAVAVVVALCLVVLVGMAAFVIDVGALYQEKRELQNGSDAGALAVAKDCALDLPTCVDGSDNPVANEYAPVNAEDNATTVDGVTIDMGQQTVTVDTSTSDPGGGTVIAYKFAQVFGLSGSPVRASATAQWGPVSSGPAVPLTISRCEWDENGGSDPFSKPVTLPSGEITLTFHSGNDANGCNPGPGSSGSDLAGGFGWLDVTDDCMASYNVDADGVWVTSKTGNTPTGTGCAPSDFALGSTVLVPIFDDLRGVGTNGEFHLIGYAAVKILGVNLTNSVGWTFGDECAVTPPEEDPAPGNGNGKKPADTGNDTQCLVAEFVNYFEADAATGGPTIPSFGADTVALIK